MKVTIKLKQGRCMTIKIIMRMIICTPECGCSHERDLARTAAQPRDWSLVCYHSL